MNKVELRGGLVRDPELRFLPSGTPVSTFTLAVNGCRWSSDEGKQIVTTQFISCQAWGTVGEQLADDDLRKGDELYVWGELDQSTFEKKDGTKENKTRVTVLVYSATRKRTSQTPSPAGSGVQNEPHDALNEPF